MQSCWSVPAALAIAGLVLGSGPSLAQGSVKGRSYLKQVSSGKIRQPVPPGRVLGSPLPDLELTPVDGTSTQTCAGPSTVNFSMDVQIKNIGNATAVLSQTPNPWAAWLRLRDLNANLFSPFTLDEFVGPPPASLAPGQFAKFHISRKLKQTASGVWQMEVTADPYNWIFEINKTNNSFGIGSGQDSVCK